MADLEKEITHLDQTFRKYLAELDRVKIGRLHRKSVRLAGIAGGWL